MKVLISGVFDLIQPGHICAFKIAKSFADYLIVNIVPDYRVKKKKGKARPVMHEMEREFIVRNLKDVDETLCVKKKSQQNQTEYEMDVIKTVKPDIFIGDDQHPKVEKFCEKIGTRYFAFPDTKSLVESHTTDIINLILERNN